MDERTPIFIDIIFVSRFDCFAFAFRSLRFAEGLRLEFCVCYLSLLSFRFAFYPFAILSRFFAFLGYIGYSLVCTLSLFASEVRR